MRMCAVMGLAAVLLAPAAGAADATWHHSVVEVFFTSPADRTRQPAMFYAPPVEGPRPLLVALHTWSRDHRHPDGAPYAEWCRQKNWIFIHPNFRGPNGEPVTTGSDAAVADILASVDYARTHANVDARRIYLVGYSGGGHASLLAAARAPQLWAGVSAWVPITDLGAWYFQTAGTGHRRYAHSIKTACGGVPVKGTPAFEECRRRSPLAHLSRAKGVRLDLNAGIDDGHGDGSVPITHAIDAFNLLAEPRHRLDAALVRTMATDARVPRRHRFKGNDASYPSGAVLFRRTSNNVRLTIFKGGHTIRRGPALTWLTQQRKPVETRNHPPR